MSIIARVKRVLSANVNILLDKADTPEMQLKQKVKELEEVIQDAKQALAGFGVSHKKMSREQEQLKRLKAEWQHKAESSLKAGDEGMAKRALEEKIKAEERIKNLQPSVEKSAETYKELKDNLVGLNDQLREARLKLSELQSRKHAATAQKTFGKKLDKATATAKDELDFSKFEEDVLQAESEVEIEKELRGEMVDLDADIEKQLSSSKVDDELEALKKKMGS